MVRAWCFGREFSSETHVGLAKVMIETQQRESNGTLKDAARWFSTKYPNLALEVMERIGSWPSSEAALAALQEVWP